jgi:dolichol-phosphate mannosyltransferase
LPESRLFKFCVVGGSGVLVDMGLLFVLSDPQMLGMGLTRSKIIAAEMAILSNFLFNDFWTFGDRVASGAGQAARFRRFLGFNAICSIGVVLNVVLLNILFNFAGFNRYLANAVAIAVVTIWNYALNSKLNWTPLRVGSPKI